MNRGREVLVGFVIIAAVVVGVGGSLWLKGTNWGQPAVPVEVLLTDVAQLAPGSAVKFRGVQVGRVSTINVEANGQAVRVTLNLTEEIPLPDDAAVLLAPESFFGDWQAEIVRKGRFPNFAFFEVPPGAVREGARVLGGYALPELSRLSAAAEQISDNLAQLSERLEIAFNDETAQNLAKAIDNYSAVSTDLRTLVDQQAGVIMSVTTSADSALNEIEATARVARRSFERVEALLADAQIDTIVSNVRAGTGSIQQIAADLSGSAQDLANTLAQADSTLARIDRVSARVEAGEGVLGRLLVDSTLAVRAEDVLRQLDFLLKDLRENPKRYVRLSIF
ncbi:MAG TPA: MlaD family protein [Longimicrobiales bacterium]|nr:MlaD family protein [Longimicrobiales bacterium]